MIDETKIKIDKYINECKKHTIRIEKAYNNVKYIFPLSAQKYDTLDDNDIASIDQYLFRFAKMQDTIGEKLFRITVARYVDDIESMTYIDILNRLEKIGILQSANEWKVLRTICNDIAHQYDDDSYEMAEALNSIFAQKDVLIGIFHNIENIVY